VPEWGIFSPKELQNLKRPACGVRLKPVVVPDEMERRSGVGEVMGDNLGLSVYDVGDER
jgi:hypothetical protein